MTKEQTRVFAFQVRCRPTGNIDQNNTAVDRFENHTFKINLCPASSLFIFSQNIKADSYCRLRTARPT